MGDVERLVGRVPEHAGLPHGGRLLGAQQAEQRPLADVHHGARAAGPARAGGRGRGRGRSRGRRGDQVGGGRGGAASQGGGGAVAADAGRETGKRSEVV